MREREREGPSTRGPVADRCGEKHDEDEQSGRPGRGPSTGGAVKPRRNRAQEGRQSERESKQRPRDSGARRQLSGRRIPSQPSLVRRGERGGPGERGRQREAERERKEALIEAELLLLLLFGWSGVEDLGSGWVRSGWFGLGREGKGSQGKGRERQGTRMDLPLAGESPGAEGRLAVRDRPATGDQRSVDSPSVSYRVCSDGPVMHVVAPAPAVSKTRGAVGNEDGEASEAR